MFVDIRNSKTPLKIANILTAYDKGVVVKGVRQPKEKLTQEVCFDILKSTNYPRCIRDILQLIAKLPDEEQAQFKDVVLACFDNREQPEPILQLGRELAEKSGYGIEFAKAQKIKDGPYLYSDVDVRKCFMCLGSEFTDEDFSAYDKVIFLSDKKIYFDADVKFPKNMEFPNSTDVSFSDKNKGLMAPKCDFDGVQSICFKDGAKVDLYVVKNLPPNLDFSRYAEVGLLGCDLREQLNLHFREGAKVNLDRAENLPPNIDFSCCDELDLSGCDLSGQPHLRFKNGAKVVLRHAYNLPTNLDFSCCDKVNLGCDLSGQPHLCFKDGAEVILNGAKNLPADLDFSMCDDVDLTSCDLSSQPNLRFKNGAKVNLCEAENFPRNLDLSKCSELWLCGDLTSLPHLCFKDGARVDLSGAENLPENLDFSMCSKVDLTSCDLSEQPHLRFKDGAKVNLSNAYNLPKNLDVSMCSDVNLEECDLNLVKELVFKNRQQMEDSCAELPDGWKGKLVFADEQPEPPALGLAMSAKANGGRL